MKYYSEKSLYFWPLPPTPFQMSNQLHSTSTNKHICTYICLPGHCCILATFLSADISSKCTGRLHFPLPAIDFMWIPVFWLLSLETRWIQESECNRRCQTSNYNGLKASRSCIAWQLLPAFKKAKHLLPNKEATSSQLRCPAVVAWRPATLWWIKKAGATARARRHIPAWVSWDEPITAVTLQLSMFPLLSWKKNWCLKNLSPNLLENH